MVKRRPWIPYLMSEDGTSRVMELKLGREFYRVEEIQEFFRNIHKTHPHLRGAKIQFEEIPVH